MTLLKPIVLSIFLLASCNKQRTFSVTLPHAYAGTVSLNCVSSADADTQAQVGDQGEGDVACPTHSSDLRVYRDGKEVPAEALKWITTGDGIVSGVQFTVR
ncbi:hypothetical protein [Granulicella aggregans]|jgi:hypothetical protein|uniref:hypothetical protein n=1 Tax=Granulicella aggregans TaxID=474949 RepID=UPI0021DF95E4|nr:hypothetical protein [Granulicella aggregans]